MSIWGTFSTSHFWTNGWGSWRCDGWKTKEGIDDMEYWTDDTIATETIQLTKLEVALQRCLEERVVMDAKLDFMHSDIARHFVARIHGYVWSEDLKEYRVVHPADWRESFKERWFPCWAKKRWPVKYTEHIFDVKVIYPDLHHEISLPEREHRLVITSSTFQ